MIIENENGETPLPLIGPSNRPQNEGNDDSNGSKDRHPNW